MCQFFFEFYTPNHSDSKLEMKKLHPNVILFPIVEKLGIHHVRWRWQAREYERAWYGGAVWGDRALLAGEAERKSEPKVPHVLEVHILQLDRGGRRHAVQPDGEVSI